LLLSLFFGEMIAKSFVIIVAVIAATICLTGVSATKTIRSMDDFLSFASDVVNDSANYDVDLQTDLDFDNIVFNLPIGVDNENKCHYYQHYDFYGNNHVIKNLKMDASKTRYGSAALFCGLHAGSIRNLTLDKTCEFTGFIAAGIAIEGTYPDLIGVNVNANVNGMFITSAFLGRVQGDIPGYIPNAHVYGCKGDASLTATNFEGGINYVGGFLGLMNYSTNGVLRFNIGFEGNSADFQITCQGGDTVVGGIIGSIENSPDAFVGMSQNAISTTFYSKKNLQTTVGGLIGRVVNVEGFDIKYKDNMLIQSDKDN